MQDPLADGPTIQASHTRGLESHTTVAKACPHMPLAASFGRHSFCSKANLLKSACLCFRANLEIWVSHQKILFRQQKTIRSGLLASRQAARISAYTSEVPEVSSPAGHWTCGESGPEDQGSHRSFPILQSNFEEGSQ